MTSATAPATVMMMTVMIKTATAITTGRAMTAIEKGHIAAVVEGKESLGSWARP